jgi:hypothetical protein
MVDAPTGMKGNDLMPDTPQLSEAKRALLEKYLRGDLLQAARTVNVTSQFTKAEVDDVRGRAVAVQTGGSRRPFFYLHGDWRGKAFYCFPLAQSMGADQPFYVLEPYLFDGLKVPPSIEAIASTHLESLRAMQPKGPYFLGGWCNGGLIAYEMARQLHADGQKVDLLALMDSMAPARLNWVRSVISRFSDLLHLGQDTQLDLFLLVRHGYRYLRFSHYRKFEGSEYLRAAEQSRLERRRDKAGFVLSRFASILRTSEALRQDYTGIFDWITSGYDPSPYPGKITFFWTSVGTHRRVEWSKRAESKEAEIHVIPGDPITSRTEHLEVLAERLKMCLDRAQSTVTP